MSPRRRRARRRCRWPRRSRLLKQFNTTKFDQSVEIAMRLGVDAKQADQIVRGSIVLPHGIGKTLRVVVFAKGDKVDEAKAAGADEVGGPELAEKIKGGWTDFDVCIAAPDMMGVVGPLGTRARSARLDAVAPGRHGHAGRRQDGQEYKAGKVEFRNDAGGNVHAVVGKLSFDAPKLVENIQAFIDHVTGMKPAAVRGQYVKGVAISATMSPSVRVAA